MARPPSPDKWSGAANVAAAEGADVAPQMGRQRPQGIMGILLHTKPALTVSETRDQLGISNGVAHFIIAGRKALDAVTSGESDSGTTVIEHVVVGTVNVVTDMSDEPQPEPEPEPEQKDELAPVVEK